MSQERNSTVAERELVLTRVLNAPRTLVYAAWTNPKHLAQWWGPTGFTAPLCELDLKPYGEIRIDMRAPDGTIYPMSGAFREIVEPSRLVFSAAALDANGTPIFENLNTVTFEDFEGTKTLLTVKVRVLWESIAAAKYLEGMEQGWTLTVDRLDSFVSSFAATEVDYSTDTTDRELRTTRVFSAPRELVYRMWTEPDLVSQWWGPNGFTITIHEMDVRVGGKWELTMHGPDGRNYHNKKVYTEIDPPSRLLFDHVSGPNHRMTVDFVEVGDKTEVRVHMVFATAELFGIIMKQFHAGKGLEETLDRLVELVQKQQA